MSYQDKLKPITTTQTPSAVGASYQQKLKPITQPETRESRMEQGLPVSSERRFAKTGQATPSFGGGIVRDSLKPFARVGQSIANVGLGVKQLESQLQGQQPQGEPFQTRASQSKYLGRIEPLGVREGKQLSPKEELKDVIGTGFEISSFLPVGTGASLAKQVIKQPFKQALKTTAKAFGREGAIQGGLGEAGRSMQEGDNLGRTIGRTIAGAGIGAGIGVGTGVGTQAISRALTKTPVEAIKQRAVDATSKALGISGKRPIKQAKIQPEQYTKGLATIRKYADNFDPKNSDNVFDDTVKGLIDAKDKVFQTYNSIAQQAGDAGVFVDTNPLQSSLTKYVSGITTAPKKQRAIRLLKELQDNFPNGKANPVEMQKYIQLLNEELGGVSGGAEKGAVGVVSDFTRQARESLDTAVGRLGKEYQSFKDEYASLKAIEDSIVRQYQKVMRKKGSGLGEYADMISSAEVLNGIISANPALIAKGGLMRVLSSKIKSLNDPETWLKRAFDEIDKAGDAFVPQARNRASQLQLPVGRVGLPRQQVNIPLRLPTRRVLDETQSPKINKFSNDEIKNFSETLVGKANEAEAGAMEQVITEMLELSEAGKRIVNYDTGIVTGSPSTFPKWIPEDLRSMELFERVIEKVQNNAKTFGVRESRLLQAMEKRANFYKKQSQQSEIDSLSVMASKNSFTDFKKIFDSKMKDFSPFSSRKQPELEKLNNELMDFAEKNQQIYAKGGNDTDLLKKFWQENNFGGEQAFGAVAGTGIAGTGGLLQRIKQRQKQKKQEKLPSVPQEITKQFNRADFSQRIVGVENEGELARGENVYKTIGITGDLGKYQVNPQTLNDWSKIWLNKEYTPQQFLNDPEAQEKFFNNFLDVVERLKLTPEEAAVTWHLGWGELGTGEPREVRDKKFREALQQRMQTEKAQNYLNKFNR